MKKILFFPLLLAGCGFTPLYSHNNTFLKDAQVIVSPIPNQYGDQMRRIIQDALLTQAENPTHKYRLVVKSPSFSAGDKTITSNELASMMQVSGKANYSLEDMATGKKIYSSNVVSVSSYAVVKDPYATTVARNHIQEELSKQLAQQISLDVLAQLSEESQ